MAEASAAVERRKASASRWTRGRARSAFGWQHPMRGVAPRDSCAFSALRLPLFFGGKSFVALVCKTRARVRRENGSARPSAPATAGEGDHWSSRSERNVVEGAPDSRLRFRCERFSSQEEASENVWTSRRLLRRVESCAPSTTPSGWSPSPAIAVVDELRCVESCAPSTTLLRRVVPLPRYRGGGKRCHILSKRLALPLRIFALSSSESGTVCMQ